MTPLGRLVVPERYLLGAPTQQNRDHRGMVWRPRTIADSALIATRMTDTGSYTAVVRGANNAQSGVAASSRFTILDIDGECRDTRLGNISTRGHVPTVDNVMIGGFIVRGRIEASDYPGPRAIP